MISFLRRFALYSFILIVVGAGGAEVLSRCGVPQPVVGLYVVAIALFGAVHIWQRLLPHLDSAEAEA